MDNLAETKRSSELIFDGKVVHLEKWVVSLPNGEKATREVIRHVGAAAIVAVDGSGCIAMVRQWRCALGRLMLEIPAGKLNYKGEDHLLAAKRELREETGLTGGDWTFLTNAVSTPGYCDETIALYLATNLQEGETDLDEDEFLNVERLPMQTLFARVEAGEIDDLKTVAALLLAKPRLIAAGLYREA